MLLQVWYGPLYEPPDPEPDTGDTGTLQSTADTGASTADTQPHDRSADKALRRPRRLWMLERAFALDGALPPSPCLVEAPMLLLILGLASANDTLPTWVSPIT